MKFSELGLDSRLIRALNDQDLEKVTEIQKQSIPKALNRQDVLGIAPTGSGKTFAFLLPTLNWLMNAKITHSDPVVLILVPTRELVKQIDEVITSLIKYSEIFTAKIFSGPRESKQIRGLKGEIDILVATPGRLLNFVESDAVSLQNISVLIIDEIDRLLDMGFLPDVNTLLQEIPHKNSRQTLLFGSTLSPAAEALTKMLQKSNSLVDVGRATSPEQIEHFAYEALDDEKFDVLLDLLHSDEIGKVLIFTQSKHEARITARNLSREGLEVEELHAGLTQTQRNHAISNFTTNVVTAMVASDVAARGLDIPDITHVINYDVPSDFNDYVHRAGRTGRAFNSGISWIIASPKEFKNLANIDKRLKRKVPRIRVIQTKRKVTKNVYSKYKRN